MSVLVFTNFICTVFTHYILECFEGMVNFAVFEERSCGEAFHSVCFSSMQSNAEHIRVKRRFHAEMCNIDSSRKADAS